MVYAAIGLTFRRHRRVADHGDHSAGVVADLQQVGGESGGFHVGNLPQALQQRVAELPVQRRTVPARTVDRGLKGIRPVGGRALAVGEAPKTVLSSSDALKTRIRVIAVTPAISIWRIRTPRGSAVPPRWSVRCVKRSAGIRPNSMPVDRG